jgi:hypothetical protein
MFESINGFKNYYGFKSLLKNGVITGRFGCDDDTIVFNRVTVIPAVTNYALDLNQVAVLMAFKGTGTFTNVNGTLSEFYSPFDYSTPRNNIAAITTVNVGAGSECIVAIFDLY